MSTHMKFWSEAAPKNCENRGSIRSAVPVSSGIRREIPALPPRLHRTGLSRQLLNGISIGGYPSGGYGFSTYPSSYGNFGYYGRNQLQDFENRYVQMAEESVSPAFESIENFVRGFSSVTMMLESTFHAIHLSFRSILGVVENMSRMKGALLEFLSAFAFLKTIYYAFKKIMYLLGLVNGKEDIWKNAEAKVIAQSTQGVSKTATKWPMLLFAMAMFGGPVLVYKYLLPEMNGPDEEIEVVALYDFDTQDPAELSFQAGEILTVKNSNYKKGWIMATKGNRKGLIPSNRVTIRSSKFVMNKALPTPDLNQPFQQI